MSAQRCPSCAATVELPADRLADLCAFCETPLVAAVDEADTVDLVVGFGVPRERAAKRLRTFLQGQFWAAESLRTAARAENLHGVLVPFYVFDGVARSDYNANVGVDWYRTETYTVVVNGKPQIRTRQVRETEWFPLAGSHVRTYTRQLVSGSRGLPEAEANALEPFDLGAALPFAPALTAGWIAELPNITHAQASETVAAEVARQENAAIRATHLPGNNSRDVQNTTKLTFRGIELALLPVWIATYRHQGKPLRLLVNGQTGEVVGTVPKSKEKIALAIGLVLVSLGIAAGTLALMAWIGSRM